MLWRCQLRWYESILWMPDFHTRIRQSWIDHKHRRYSIDPDDKYLEIVNTLYFGRTVYTPSTGSSASIPKGNIRCHIVSRGNREQYGY